MKASAGRGKDKIQVGTKNATGKQKRISVQEARKYFRKKNHSELPILFWRSKERQ